MIVRIRGQLESVSGGEAVIAVGDLAYQVLVPEMTERRLAGRVGEQIELYTLYYLQGFGVGSMQPVLLGFETEIDRQFFQLLTTVEGLGPKAVLKLLTEPVGAIAAAIEREDEAFLRRLPGLGRQRSRSVIAKLRGKAEAFVAADAAAAAEDGAAAGDSAQAAGAPAVQDELEAEVTAILLQLGYSEREAETMLAQARRRRPDLDDASALVQEIFSPSGPAETGGRTP